MFDVAYTGFSSNFTILETGEYFGLDYLGDAVGLSHGALVNDGAKVSTSKAWYYNTGDSPGGGGALQLGVADGEYTPPKLVFHVKGVVVEGWGQALGPKTYSVRDKTVLYTHPLSLTTLAGTYDGFFLMLGKDVPHVVRVKVTGMTVGADGKYSVKVGDSTISGTMTPHGATGAFDATSNGPAAGGSGTTGTYKGIVAPQTITARQTVLAFELYGPSDPTQTAPTSAFILYVTKLTS